MWNALATPVTATISALAVSPPPIGEVERPLAILYYGVLVVLVAATVALSIMPAKRGHQD